MLRGGSRESYLLLSAEVCLPRLWVASSMAPSQLPAVLTLPPWACEQRWTLRFLNAVRRRGLSRYVHSGIFVDAPRRSLTFFTASLSLLQMPVRFGSGGGHGDHHPHYVFDTSTPYNPFGAPLGIFLGVVVGGLAVSGIAFANGMSKGASK